MSGMNSKKQEKTAISPTRAENYPEWYQEVIQAADLAENAPVRGCMVIKPRGYALWEEIQSYMDRKFKKLGVQNAYFPLFIPLSFFEKEAEHIEGFAKECAIVTHTRLEPGKEGGLVPSGPLAEPLVVRPTSETIIGASFAKWIESYRDLPLLINQWCNVVRWEMRPRLFLRTSEFLWQEGHTAHADEKEAREFALGILDLYTDFIEQILAMPVIKGEKSEGERFPGAESTYTCESMMQDGKALQMCTSHYMGTTFAKSSNIRYLPKEGELTYAHTTSWGSTTRLIGALIMGHGDDNGLIIPPRIAPTQIVIIPVTMAEESRERVLSACRALKEKLEKVLYHGKELSISLDVRDLRAGDKSWDAVKKGTPLRLEIGPRDLDQDRIPLFARTKEKKEAVFHTLEELPGVIPALLDEVQKTLYERALAHRKANTKMVATMEEFVAAAEHDAFPTQFILVPWAGNRALEAEIKEKHGVTIRCIPVDQPAAPGRCPFTGQENALYVIFAKSY